MNGREGMVGWWAKMFLSGVYYYTRICGGGAAAETTHRWRVSTVFPVRVRVLSAGGACALMVL